LITAYDYAAVQITVGKVEDGLYKGKQDTYALCGYIRDKVRGCGAFSLIVFPSPLPSPDDPRPPPNPQGEANAALDALVAETKKKESKVGGGGEQ
jgi:hypothetical protein